METLALQCLRSDTGSISAPARKVRSTEPIEARKVVYEVCWTCSLIPGMFPASAPTTISTRATGTTIRMLTTEAKSAMPIQMAAT